MDRSWLRLEYLLIFFISLGSFEAIMVAFCFSWIAHGCCTEITTVHALAFVDILHWVRDGGQGGHMAGGQNQSRKSQIQLMQIKPSANNRRHCFLKTALDRSP